MSDGPVRQRTVVDPFANKVVDVAQDGRGRWPDLRGMTTPELIVERVAGMPLGMKSGRPSVAIIARPKAGGEPYFIEVSYLLFMAAADVLRAKYGEGAPGAGAEEEFAKRQAAAVPPSNPETT